MLQELPTRGNKPLGSDLRSAPTGAAPSSVFSPGDLLGSKFGDAGLPPTRPYEVQKGDSIERIARRELGDASAAAQIIASNPGLQPERLRVGQVIQLPAADRATKRASPPGSSPRSDSLRSEQGGETAASALVDLTSRYLDLQEEIELQRESAAQNRKMASGGWVEKGESKTAETRLRTLERKLAIVARLIDGEIAATEAELHWLKARREAGLSDEHSLIDQQIDRARTRLEVLRSVK